MEEVSKILFYDFEVFKYDWLVVVADMTTKTFHTIVNSPRKLKALYEAHKNDIWIGYNSRHYDQYILKAILAGFNPKDVNDWIIKYGRGGWEFSSVLNEYPVINFDIMPNPPVGLKTMEGFMGNNIHETGVPFDIGRKLTNEEIEETLRYCRHDVENTIEVFLRRKSEFESHLSLIKAFNLPLRYLSKTKAQLSAIILGCQPVNYQDEWDLSVLPCVELHKYAYVIDWFLDKKNHVYKWENGNKPHLETLVAGVPHTFAWGGLHGALEKYHGTGCLLHIDVKSYYPALMIGWNLLTRACKNPEKYREIRDKRLKYKKEKNPLQAPYKIVLNSTYGICNDKYSLAYDPNRAHMITMNGQLMLLMLIEMLEVVPGFELIQSNTDGLIIKIPDTDEAFEQVDDICYMWEKKCRCELEFDYIREIYQKDVNNYLFITDDGELERKGAYVKENSPLDNDLPILNKALVEYMTHNIPVEQTILTCKDLIEFQKIVKLSEKYRWVEHNGNKFTNKSYRVFASKNYADGKIYKCRTDERPAKFGNTPERCFIENGDIKGKRVPHKLDKQWYVALAKKRLEDYGVIA